MGKKMLVSMVLLAVFVLVGCGTMSIEGEVVIPDEPVAEATREETEDLVDVSEEPQPMVVEDTPPVELAETWVYVEMDDWSQLIPEATVTWVDMGSGAVQSVSTLGKNHRLVGEWVYYQEGDFGTVHRVNADGQDERFDFMGIPEDEMDPNQVDWAISPDGTQIVWTRDFFEPGEGYEVTLTSELYVADIATGETRLLTTHVDDQLYLAPWSFSADGSQIFVYEQVWGIGGWFFVCGAFSVMDVATGEITPLPDPITEEAHRPATLSDDGTRLVRFGSEADVEGEGVHVTLTDLTTGQTTAVSTDFIFPQARVGDGLLSPDGSTLAFVAISGEGGSETFALFQVDFSTGTQQELLAAQPTYYRVLRFMDDGSLLLTAPWPRAGEAGTFRLHPDGTLEHFSDSTFLGVSE